MKLNRFASLVAAALLPAAALNAAQTIGLETLDLTKMRQGWGKPQINRSIREKPLSIAGKKFEHGVGTHAASTLWVELDGGTERFLAQVGVDDAAGGAATVEFRVVADGRKLFDSGVMKPGDAAKVVEVDLKGVKTVLYGRDAVVGEPDSYRLALTFTRVMRGMGGEAHEYTFTVLRQTADLPAATLLSLYEQLENPTRDERLGMLLFCYENGLMDDAPRLAWKLWKADESVKPDLDALMAAKLGIEVPQGGFIERDGRLETK